jgi:hypothetical protein
MQVNIKGQEQGWGDKPNSQRSCYHPAEDGKATKAENRAGATGQPPKVWQVVDHGADHLGQKAAFKSQLPHFAGRGWGGG